jgi:hypothetical protein
MPLRERVAPFLLPIAVSAVIVLSGPWIGELRSWTRRAFPGEYRLIINGVTVLFILAAGAAVIMRIREQRLLRYATMAAAVVLAWLYLAIWAPASPDVAAVERFHFVEYGLATFLFYRAFTDTEPPSPATLVQTTLAALLVGIADEWFQWFVPERVGEIKDIFLNGAAIACGLLVSAAARPLRGFAWSIPRASLTRTGLMTSATILALAVFFHVVHLGYVIEDAEIGEFRSRYTKRQLELAAVDRAREWSRAPPSLTLVRFSREDQYLHEALWHVQSRNEAWGRGDAATAWRENRILEKYFDPALDARTYVSRTGHRWPQEQRTDAARRGGSQELRFVSRADTPTLTIWPKSTMWTIVLVLSGLVLALTVRRP